VADVADVGGGRGNIEPPLFPDFFGTNPAAKSSPIPVCRVRQAKCREAWSRENDRRVYQYYLYARFLVQL